MFLPMIDLARTVVPFVLGCILSVAGIAEPSVHEDAIVFRSQIGSAKGISVGGMIFVFDEQTTEHDFGYNYIKRHEYGHVIQYRKYRRFYPFLVSIPSLFGELINDLSGPLGGTYKGFAEREADILGGVPSTFREYYEMIFPEIFGIPYPVVSTQVFSPQK